MQLRPQGNPGPQVFRINDPNRLYQAHFERNHVFSSKRRFKTPTLCFNQYPEYEFLFGKHFLAQTSLTEKPEPATRRVHPNLDQQRCRGWTQLHLKKWSKPTMDCLLSRIFFLNDLGGNSKSNAKPPHRKDGQCSNVLGWQKLATVQNPRLVEVQLHHWFVNPPKR